MSESDYTATYSPEDNKLRLYAGGRLPADTYAQAKAHGFRWAPKQELFVAPMWTPDREDFLLDLAGEIDDEDTSLVDRAEQRADRFEDYSDNRKDDAERAHAAVSAIADGIPMGQPILVGHHSERHARRDAKKIENGMRRAVKMWEQSEYWIDRAKGAIRHAKYKELPAVRARRIKGLEADKRKQEKNKARAEIYLKLWGKPDLTHGQALSIANNCDCSLSLPRKEGDREGWSYTPSAYDALTNSHPSLYAPRSLEEVIETARNSYPRRIARAQRWIDHYENRLAYERAMLGESGGIVTDRTGPEKGGGVKCWASPGYGQGWSYIQKVNKVSVSVLDNWGNPSDLAGGRNFKRTIPFDKLKAVMTAAEVQAARDAGELNELPSGIGFYLSQTVETRDEASARVHREAVAAAGGSCDCKDCTYDAKIDQAVAPLMADIDGAICEIDNNAGTIRQLGREDFDAMKQTLKAGVQVVSAPQLFPTPRELAARMAEEAGIKAGDCVLEPCAGTGNLIIAIKELGFNGNIHLDAIEINYDLCKKLRGYGIEVDQQDFLEVEKPYCPDAPDGWDRIVMNPPFSNGTDIKHIQHARKLLKPGGRLVALCANGPRQREALEPIADYWEDLPAGSFSEQGTNVNVALLIINAPAAGSLF